MEKLLALFEKCGMKPELSKELIDSVQAHLTEHRAALDESFEKRLEAAKKVCVVETENHKAELSRRLQIWCEAVVTKIEAMTSKTAAVREGDASLKLEQIYKLLEGVGDDSAIKARIDRLSNQVKKLAEERNAAVQKANRVNAISEKVMARNRELERQVGGAGQRRQAPVQRAIPTEGRVAPAARLDTTRQNGQATTTRRTLHETTAQRLPPVQQNADGQSEVPATGIAAIADSIDEIPPA